MRLASSPQWGEPKVRRTGHADFSASRDLSSDTITSKSLGGAALTFLTAFGHAIDAPTTVCFETTANILNSSCHAHHSPAVDQFLSAGPFQSRVETERTKLGDSRLQPLQGGAPSVGLGVILHRCATGASRIRCLRTPLTSCCVRAWQDSSRVCLRQPMIKCAHVAYGSSSLRGCAARGCARSS